MRNAADAAGPIVKPPPIKPTSTPPPPAVPPTYTQAQVDASLAANPHAAGSNGTFFTYTSQNGQSQSANSDPSQNWAQAFFGALGLPDDVMNGVINVLREHAEDQNLAQALATQYIRSTKWYAVHYPGALEGIAKGVIGSEADYSSYVNQLNVLSRQYNGRDISGDEVKGYLQQGLDAGYVSRLYGGQAWSQANRQDVNYELGAFGEGAPGAGDMTALGNENAGIDSQLGQQMQLRLQKAVQQMHSIFSGSLGAPSLTSGANGLSAPSLLGNKQQPDIGT